MRTIASMMKAIPREPIAKFSALFLKPSAISDVESIGEPPNLTNPPRASQWRESDIVECIINRRDGGRNELRKIQTLNPIRISAI